MKTLNRIHFGAVSWHGLPTTTTSWNKTKQTVWAHNSRSRKRGTYIHHIHHTTLYAQTNNIIKTAVRTLHA